LGTPPRTESRVFSGAGAAVSMQSPLGPVRAGAATLRRAHAAHPISALQSEYSLWERGVERAVLPACRALGTGLVPCSPHGRGGGPGCARTGVRRRSGWRPSTGTIRIASDPAPRTNYSSSIIRAGASPRDPAGPPPGDSHGKSHPQ